MTLDADDDGLIAPLHVFSFTPGGRRRQSGRNPVAGGPRNRDVLMIKILFPLHGLGECRAKRALRRGLRFLLLDPGQGLARLCGRLRIALHLTPA